MSARAPAVAGAFYPDDPAALTAMVESMLAAVKVPEGDEPAAGYVVPHAGYRFSGPTAAEVYARLRRHAAEIHRVILVGPSHYVPVDGATMPTVDNWATPLGDMEVDAHLRGELLAGRYGVADDLPHLREHSLEVQLPFLIRALGSKPVLPIAVGASPVENVVDIIDAAVTAGGDGTIVLCSTDLSHYHDHATAQLVDRRTAEAVLDLEPERVGVRDACGAFALRGITGWARRRKLLPELLDLRTSADTQGRPERVVGYPAFAFRAERTAPLTGE